MLKYIGQGAFLPGVPARDLSDDEAAIFDKKLLLKSGLYEEVKPRTHFKFEKQQEEHKSWLE